MATKKVEATAVLDEDRVEVFLPPKKDEPDKLVGVNGVMYQIPRGKPCKVPRHIYDELKRAERAEIHQFMVQQELQEQGKTAR